MAKHLDREILLLDELEEGGSLNATEEVSVFVTTPLILLMFLSFMIWLM